MSCTRAGSTGVLCQQANRSAFPLSHLGGQAWQDIRSIPKYTVEISVRPPVDALARTVFPYGVIVSPINTDQGSQFTSMAFTARLQAAGIRISMDGRGRCMDNIFIERLWRSLKYEAVYLHEIADGFTARRVIGEWIGFYN